MFKYGLKLLRGTNSNYNHFNRRICNCEILKQIPSDKQIDYQVPLKGTKIDYYKHLLILSNKNAKDWPSRLEMDPESMISNFNTFKRKITSNMHPVLISEISLIDYHKDSSEVENENENGNGSDKFKAILYPDNLIFPKLNKNNENIQTYSMLYIHI